MKAGMAATGPLTNTHAAMEETQLLVPYPCNATSESQTAGCLCDTCIIRWVWLKCSESHKCKTLVTHQAGPKTRTDLC